MHRWIVILFTAVFFTAGPSGNPVFAQDFVLTDDMTAEEKGLAIANEADLRDMGFEDSAADLTMVLGNRNGDESIRNLRIETLEVNEEGRGDKSMAVFDRPRDVKGTALLTFSNILEPDEQWMFLPALKRVKRISSVNKSGPFVGSEFAYEDMASQEVGKYRHIYLRDEACGDLTCYVIERIPLYEYSGYTRQIVWLDQEEFRTFKVEFYDRRDSLLKTLYASDHRLYLNKHWRAHDLFMENHLTGKTTRLLWDEFRFRAGLNDSDFSRASLLRVR